MKKILLSILILLSFSASAQRMLVLPDTPQYANLNRGVWVFRIADALPYYSNGVRWIANTGGLSPQTISDSLAAFTGRVVTSYNGSRGAVRGVDSVWFTNLGTVLNWRYNGINYNQLITGTGSVPDSTLFATVNYVNSNFATISNLNLKLNIADTANKWLTDVYRKAGTDSVFKVKGGTHSFAFKDSVGTGGGGGVSDGDKGDITVSSSGTVWTIDNNAVTNAKINDVAWSKITGAPSFLLAGDTAAMLTPYLRSNVAAATYVPLTRTINGLDLSTNRTFTTSDIGEGSNLYFTDTRSRSAISLTTTGTGAATYNSGTGVLNVPTPSASTPNADSTAARIRRGTVEQRLQLTPDSGMVFYQTNELEGVYTYNGSIWHYQALTNNHHLCDFVGTNMTNWAVRYEYTSDVSGGGSIAAIPITTDKTSAGNYRATIGATSSAAGFRLGPSSSQDSCYGTSFINAMRFRISNLSDGTDRYSMAWGSSPTLFGGVASSGSVNFRYDHTINSGNITIQYHNGVTTNFDTGIAFAANTWYTIVQSYNANTRVFTWWVNGVQVDSRYYNLTTASIYNVMSSFKYSGSNTRTIDIDFSYLIYKP
jgi:hypothetical protein